VKRFEVTNVKPDGVSRIGVPLFPTELREQKIIAEN
jgi:hypothetical protein